MYLKSVKGTAMCTNPSCPLKLISETHKGRDRVSAFAIGISGCAYLLLGKPIRVFDPENIEERNYNHFTKILEDFLA